jgi:predicted Zn finger-like uncharacterized protein
MIIQCDHCSAKFRMDDSKLANGPVKVRCAKCKEVFSVSKEEPSPEIPDSLKQNESTALPDTAAGGGAAAESPPASPDLNGFSDNAFNESSAADFSFNLDDMPSSQTPSAAFGEVADSAPSGFDLSGADEGNSEQGSGLDISFPSGGGDFDFGDSPSPEMTLSAGVGSLPSTANAENDFSMDFGEVSFSDPLSAKTASDESELSNNTDLSDQSSFSADSAPPATAGEDADFNFSFNEDAAADVPTPEPAMPESGSVNFGDFDFGEMNQPAGGQVAPGVEKQQQNFTVDTESSKVTSGMAAPLYDNDDIPPSSLSSRKKRGSFFPLTVILGAILLVILLAGSAVYFVSGPKAFSKVGLGFLVDWYGAKGGEEGSVSVRNITAEYLINKEAGELFVVRGEALNNYKKPRASIQIKVTILGSGGVPLLTKTAFCGNSLSKEQLASLSLVKIEETMNNQFGDSLANMGVKPGNAIPFVVVLSSVPKEASDYSVQVNGSTIATQ